MVAVRQLEFWPEYGGGLLWSDSGKPVSLQSLPLSDALQSAATDWVGDHDDGKLPWEPTRDDAWLARGRQLLADLRDALAPHSFVVQPGEDYWEPSSVDE